MKRPPDRPFQQRAGLNFDRPGELDDRVEARESGSLLDVGDVGAVKIGTVGNGVLGESGTSAR